MLARWYNFDYDTGLQKSLWKLLRNLQIGLPYDQPFYPCVY